MELTREDISTLLEALDAWEAKDASGFLITSMLSAVTHRDDREALDAEFEVKAAEYQEKVRARKEQAVFLKAKLLHLRDQRDARAFIAEAFGR